MTRYLCDTSVLVATVCSWHEHHARTVVELERRERAGEELVLAAHSLAEAYAVLTRLPAPNRLRSEDAIELLEANWRETPVVHLTAAETWRTLRTAAAAGSDRRTDLRHAHRGMRPESWRHYAHHVEHAPLRRGDTRDTRSGTGLIVRQIRLEVADKVAGQWGLTPESTARSALERLQPAVAVYRNVGCSGHAFGKHVKPLDAQAVVVVRARAGSRRSGRGKGCR